MGCPNVLETEGQPLIYVFFLFCTSKRSSARKPFGACTQITRMDIILPSYFRIRSSPSRISAAPMIANQAQKGTHKTISRTPPAISAYPATRKRMLLPLG